ncbi:methyltransferase domain-containing protein [archaeon]|nr:methyltransferase domain-containing protein [archaeon]
MQKMGMRKGKKKAIHTFGEVVDITEARPYRIEIFKTFSNEPLCTVYSDELVGDGLVYIAIAPAGDGKKGMKLKELKKERDQLIAKFEAGKGPIKKAEITLDDRGRAQNLVVGAYYIFNVFKRREFFEGYERKSIPVGKGARSEPGKTGEERIANFLELMDVKKGDRVLDTATGMKEYLRQVSKKRGSLTCLNMSPSILKRTRGWLGDENANFVAYDIEEGFPFKYGTFDVVICDALLEYVSDCHEALAQAGGLVKKGGSLLLLEPVKSTARDFYPQDMWEVALWRPGHDPVFNTRCMRETLMSRKFEVVEKREMRFEYPLYKKEEFCQSIAKFQKSI